jgi:O-methyltransferase involved in polyketide biosynthesis
MPALSRAGHDPSAPTAWIWEGVVPYLTAAAVEATVERIADRSAPGSVLVVNYQSRSLVALLGRHLQGLAARASGQGDLLTREPWRSLWTRHGCATCWRGTVSRSIAMRTC